MSLALRTRDLFNWDPFLSYTTARQPAFAPAFEVKEVADAYVIKADMPGVAESDLEIAVHDNILTISGSRKAEERKENESFSLYERRFGSFTRSFSLSDTADAENVTAKLANGVLELKIGKKPELKPRKIALSK